MRQAMEQHGVEPGVASDHFPGIPGSRIAVEDDGDFLFQAFKHRLQIKGKAAELTMS
ncbi:hypothetical protein D3C83_33020 [compost metagenome]